MDSIIKECCWETTDGLSELRGRLEPIYELRDAELRDMANRVQWMRDAVNAAKDAIETEFARLDEALALHRAATL